jgi:uncharacterized protein YjbI with pentapeptide repeats
MECDLSNSDLSAYIFTECKFIACNLSMAKVVKTAFRDTVFRDCKLLGVHFHTSNEFLFSVTFENCTLNLCAFYNMKLKKMKFSGCTLQEVDFTGADLSSAVFADCDLSRTTFENTNLEKADFRTAVNYSIDPELNRLKKARFSIQGLPGLLDKYDLDVE